MVEHTLPCPRLMRACGWGAVLVLLSGAVAMASEHIDGFHLVPNFGKVIHDQAQGRLIVNTEADAALNPLDCANACLRDRRCKGFQSQRNTAPRCQLIDNRLEFDENWEFYEKRLSISGASEEDHQRQMKVSKAARIMSRALERAETLKLEDAAYQLEQQPEHQRAAAKHNKKLKSIVGLAKVQAEEASSKAGEECARIAADGASSLMELQAQTASQQEAIEQLDQSSAQNRKMVRETAKQLSDDVDEMAKETVAVEQFHVQSVLDKAQALQDETKQVTDKLDLLKPVDPLLGETGTVAPALALSMFTSLGKLDVRKLSTIDPPIATTEEEESVDCADRCENNFKCASFVFHDKTCELFTVSLATDADIEYFERRVSASEIDVSAKGTQDKAKRRIRSQKPIHVSMLSKHVSMKQRALAFMKKRSEEQLADARKKAFRIVQNAKRVAEDRVHNCRRAEEIKHQKAEEKLAKSTKKLHFDVSFAARKLDATKKTAVEKRDVSVDASLDKTATVEKALKSAQATLQRSQKAAKQAFQEQDKIAQKAPVSKNLIV